jgi:hypothetical protein
MQIILSDPLSTKSHFVIGLAVSGQFVMAAGRFQ